MFEPPHARYALSGAQGGVCNVLLLGPGRIFDKREGGKPLGMGQDCHNLEAKVVFTENGLVVEKDTSCAPLVTTQRTSGRGAGVIRAFQGAGLLLPGRSDAEGDRTRQPVVAGRQTHAGTWAGEECNGGGCTEGRGSLFQPLAAMHWKGEKFPDLVLGAKPAA